jgi:ABC-type branched-subunit amino acid transport system substrate-binding protein
LHAATDENHPSASENILQTLPHDNSPHSMMRLILLCSIACVVPISGSTQQPQKHIQLRIGLITTTGGAEASDGASIARGVRLGAAESRQTAQLFGDDVQLFEAAGAGATAVASADRLVSSNKIGILIGTSDVDAEALSRFSERHHIIFLNAASRSQSLRSACNRYTFHVEATDAMYSSAAGRGNLVPSPARSAVLRSLGARTDSIVLWSSILERFGASQINDRYRDKYKTGMDGGAWAGWAAVKFGAEAALRARSASPGQLLAYLESPATQFDGHKGWPLTFRLSDHQLRQPLYMVAARSADTAKPSVRDIPDLRAHLSSNSRSDRGGRASDRILDSLMASDARACPWSNGR